MRTLLFAMVGLQAIWLAFMLTLPLPRYFLPRFPALAIVMSRGLTTVSGHHAGVVLLALSYWGVVLSRTFWLEIFLRKYAP